MGRSPKSTTARAQTATDDVQNPPTEAANDQNEGKIIWDKRPEHWRGPKSSGTVAFN